MKLSIVRRKKKSKSQLTEMRAKKNIPAILYGKGRENIIAEVSGEEFARVLRKIPQNHLSNTVFELSLEDQTFKAVVKGIQYDKITYEPLHIDLMVAEDLDLVTVNIPIHYVGAIDCVGIKLGGVLRPVLRSFKVRCPLKDIPESFTVDVKSMQIGDSKRLSHISLSENVVPQVNVNEVAVTIAKR